MRLFFAVNFSEEIVARLAVLRDTLGASAAGGRFTKTEQFHLTLAFLGERDQMELEKAMAVLDALSIPPMKLSIDRLGRFRRNDGDIWWAGVQKNDALLALQRDLTAALRSAGFSLENRPYTPHITLGRRVVTEIAPWQISPFGEIASSVELMVSERIQGQLTYRIIRGNPK